MNSEAYKVACQVHLAAAAKFRTISKNYRTRKIGDAEFRAAQEEFREATREFDEAFRVEIKRIKLNN